MSSRSSLFKELDIVCEQNPVVKEAIQAFENGEVTLEVALATAVICMHKINSMGKDTASIEDKLLQSFFPVICRKSPSW